MVEALGSSLRPKDAANPYRTPDVPESVKADERVRELFDAQIAAAARERVEANYAWAHRQRRLRRILVIGTGTTIVVALAGAALRFALYGTEPHWYDLVLFAIVIAVVFAVVLVNGLVVRLPVDPFRKKP